MRDQLYQKTTDKKEKLKLEKLHSMERSKAQLRIQRLNEYIYESLWKQARLGGVKTQSKIQDFLSLC